MDLTDFDSSLLVWGEDVNLADKAMQQHAGNLSSHDDDLVVDGSDTIEQVTLALLNGDSSNNTTLMPSLLNNFVSAMADQRMSSVALGQSGEGSFHYSLYDASSNAMHFSQIQNTVETTAVPIQHLPNMMDLSQRNAKLPQHLMINQNPHVKDGYSIQATTPIFPPNYFLPPGMTPWDPITTGVQHGGNMAPMTTTTATTAGAIQGTSLLHPHHYYSQTHTHLTHPNLMITNPTVGGGTSPSNPTHHLEAVQHWRGGEETLMTHDPNGIFQAPSLLSSFLDAQRWHNSNDSSSLHVAPTSNSSTGGGPNRDSRIQQPRNVSTTTSIKKSTASDRNEREQRRAQQITELIDELRDSMVKAGWKVELKGKYHTLSRCIEYLHHLKNVTKEKEDAIERTKSNIAIRKQKMDEDKAVVENRSDPESVVSQISSLTDEDNTVMHESMKKRWSDRNDTDTEGHQHISKKISSESESNHNGSEDGAVSSESGIHTDEGRKHVSIGNMCSSISDITDKGINSSANESRRSRHSDFALFVKNGEDDELEAASSSSISSTAAVFSGIGSNDRPSRNVDISINHGDKLSEHRSKRRAEVSSQHKNFVLDYEEVFRTSNIPQLIAAPSGRVIACNDFFLQSLGLQNTCNMTLFSFVHPDKLADLFELVSKQLRFNKNAEMEDQACKHESITLPCIQCPKQSSSDNIPTNPPMFMHVTLLRDSEPSKSCFHCILTDEPGTEGKIGCISVDMLARMFCKTRP